MSFTNAHLCARNAGGLGHRWDIIPVEWEPNTQWFYDDIDNYRCERCGKIKAVLFDSNYDRYTLYKGKTGVVYGADDARPTPEDIRRMLHAKVARIEDQRARRGNLAAVAS